MAGREFHYTFKVRLQSSAEDLWPLVSDTNRFNRDSSLARIEIREDEGERAGGYGQNARSLQRFYTLGMPFELEEEPFEWVRPFRFGVVRRFSRGLISELRVLAELQPRADGGTDLSYQVWPRAANILGMIAVPVQIGIINGFLFKRAFRRFDKLIRQGDTLRSSSPVKLEPGGHARLKENRAALLEAGAHPDLVEILIDFIANGDEMTLDKIRPYVLADFRGIPRRDMLEACLWATRTGLLDLQWDLLCPLCRGAKYSSDTLRGVKSQVHCDTCNIDYTVNFERSVELTFRPNPSIRSVASQEFCIGGPQITPHVVVQQLLAPGVDRVVMPELEAGRHRLRALEKTGGQYFRVQPGGLRDVTLTVADDGWPNDEPIIAPDCRLLLKNDSADEQLFIIERLAWSDEAVTAAEVTALQLFRDLFATEALRPGDQFSVGKLTILFTDLRGSTSLYREVGDARAFGLVMEHFDLLRAAIVEEEGAIVKTIGDAIMAVFPRPDMALRAALRAQQTIAQPPRDGLGLRLKVGINYGPCIAVTLNDRLDYFGSAVNMAARLETLSTGEDVVIGEDVFNDPAVARMLDDAAYDLTATAFDAELKGFDAARFRLWRVRAGRRKMPTAQASRLLAAKSF